MFSQLLTRSIQIGEKVFHVLCDINLHAEEWEKLGIEIIKDASAIKERIKNQQEQEDAEKKPEEAASKEKLPEEVKEEPKE